MRIVLLAYTDFTPGLEGLAEWRSFGFWHEGLGSNLFSLAAMALVCLSWVLVLELNLRSTRLVQGQSAMSGARWALFALAAWSLVLSLETWFRRPGAWLLARVPRSARAQRPPLPACVRRAMIPASRRQRSPCWRRPTTSPPATGGGPPIRLRLLTLASSGTGVTMPVEAIGPELVGPAARGQCVVLDAGGNRLAQLPTDAAWQAWMAQQAPAAARPDRLAGWPAPLPRQPLPLGRPSLISSVLLQRLPRRLAVMAVDALLIALSFWLSFALRIGQWNPPWFQSNLHLLPWAVGIGWLVLLLSGWYRGLTRYSGSHTLYGLLPRSGLIVLLLLLVSTLSGRADPPFRSFWILFWLLFSGAAIAVRIGLRDLLRLWLARPSLRTRSASGTGEGRPGAGGGLRGRPGGGPAAGRPSLQERLSGAGRCR